MSATLNASIEVVRKELRPGEGAGSAALAQLRAEVQAMQPATTTEDQRKQLGNLYQEIQKRLNAVPEADRGTPAYVDIRAESQAIEKELVRLGVNTQLQAQQNSIMEGMMKMTDEARQKLEKFSKENPAVMPAVAVVGTAVAGYGLYQLAAHGADRVRGWFATLFGGGAAAAGAWFLPQDVRNSLNENLTRAGEFLQDNVVDPIVDLGLRFLPVSEEFRKSVLDNRAKRRAEREKNQAEQKKKQAESKAKEAETKTKEGEVKAKEAETKVKEAEDTKKAEEAKKAEEVTKAEEVKKAEAAKKAAEAVPEFASASALLSTIGDGPLLGNLPPSVRVDGVRLDVRDGNIFANDRQVTARFSMGPLGSWRPLDLATVSRNGANFQFPDGTATRRTTVVRAGNELASALTAFRNGQNVYLGGIPGIARIELRVA